ncbi:cadherin-like beta sandwich domain-containing protein [Paenibacillus sinopodophylli]|uniref:cadherin-like beta sandwich domain-containing protein n=1 Tax=Paenibacillus sinopodophylli TaxID=1837342 RepID=UPI00110C90A6|nr:cadherin-like beta sandwich domain-containing protein [Paenibacillus sinopodophylli]
MNARSGSQGSNSSSVYPLGNADLKQLRAMVGGNELGLTPAFTAGTTSYRVETSAAQVEIQAIQADINAAVTLLEETYTGARTVSLAEGDNIFKITIKAKNGMIKIYGLIIHRN